MNTLSSFQTHCSTQTTLMSESVGGLRLLANQHQSGSEVTKDLKYRVVIFGPFPPSCFSSWVALSHRKPFQLGRADRIKGRAERTHTQQTTHMNRCRTIRIQRLTREGNSTDHTQAKALLACGCRGTFMGMYSENK